MAVVSVECPRNIVTYSLVLVANNNVRHVDTRRDSESRGALTQETRVRRTHTLHGGL